MIKKKKEEETPVNEKHKIQNGAYFWRGSVIGGMRIRKGTKKAPKVLVIFLKVSSLYTGAHFIVIVILIVHLYYFVSILSKQKQSKTKQKKQKLSIK